MWSPAGPESCWTEYVSSLASSLFLGTVQRKHWFQPKKPSIVWTHSIQRTIFSCMKPPVISTFDLYGVSFLEIKEGPFQWWCPVYRIPCKPICLIPSLGAGVLFSWEFDEWVMLLLYCMCIFFNVALFYAHDKVAAAYICGIFYIGMC